MRRLIICAIGIGLILTSQRTWAQNDLPPILDPAQVFTEAVEVTETQPLLNFDNENSRLFFLDTGAKSWQVVALPEKFYGVPNYVRRSDGSYLVGDSFAEYLDRNPDDIPNVRPRTWLFTPSTGQFSHPESACGVVKALPGEGRWVIYQPRENASHHFCFNETGELSPALPEKRQVDFCESEFTGLGPFQAVLAPDGKHVISLICRSERVVALYAYDISAHDITFLGTTEIPEHKHLKVENWADNTHPVLSLRETRLGQGTEADGLTQALLVMDLAQSNSLKTIVSNDTLRSDGAMHYLWLSAAHSSLQTPTSDDCRLHEFDLKTLNIKIYDPIPGVCGLGLDIPDGSGSRLYLADDQANKAAARLIRFNLHTGAAQTIYTGEINMLVSISPKGRYAELNVGNLMQLYRSGTLPQSDGPTLQILEISTGKIVVKESYYISDPVVAPLIAPVLSWIDDTTFLFTGGTIYETSVYQIKDGKVDEIHYFPRRSPTDPIDYKYIFFTNHRQLITDPDTEHVLGITDPETKRLIPIVNPVPASCCFGGSAVKYVVDGTLDENDIIRVEIYFWYGKHGEQFRLGAWTLRLK